MKYPIGSFHKKAQAWMKVVLLASILLWGFDPAQARQNHGNELEVKTRAEDEAAEAVFQSSLRGMRALIKQKANSKEEARLLSQFAETLSKMAAIQFRLVHGEGGGSESNRYRSTLNEIVQTENILIKKYSKSKDLGRYYFVRARALKELGQDDYAIVDFKNMIDRFPNSPNISDAVFSLNDLLSRKKDYKTALTYLHKIENHRTESYYPMLIDNLGFAYYYINDYTNALKYLHYELSLVGHEKGNLVQERSKILKNCMLFYFTAMTKNVPGYTSKSIFPYLQSLNPASAFSEVLKYVSYLIRARGRDSDLEALKFEVLYAKLPFIDTLEFLFVVFENEINKRQFSHIHETVDIFDKLAQQMRNNPQYKTHYDQVYQVLGDSVQKLQALFTRKEEVQSKFIIESALISMLEALLKGTSDSAGQLKIHFNLAEVYYQRKDFASATRHYAWIVHNKGTDTANSSFVEQSKFKLITSEYASLSVKQIFPKEVKPVAMEGVQAKTMVPEVQNWVASVGDLFRTRHDEEIATFVLESGRLLYSYGHISEAITLFNQLIMLLPNSVFAAPAALLILNTYIASHKWSEANTTAADYQKKMIYAKPEFKTTLRTLLSDTNFKLIEALYQEGKYVEVLPQVDQFLKVYSDSPRRHDALSLAGNAGLALKDKKRALTYFNAMLKEKGSGKGVAYLANADDAEQNFRFSEAATYYRNYIELPAQEKSLSPQELGQLKRKIVLLSWLAGDSGLLKSTLQATQVCTTEVTDLCGDLKVFQEMIAPPSPQALLDHWKRASVSQRAILTPALLRRPTALPIADRLLVLKELSADWEQSTPLMKYALLPYLSQLIQPALSQSGLEIQKLSPLLLDKVKIQARTQWIKKMEEALEKLLGLSWGRVRAAVYYEWANLYAQFADDIRGIPKPKGLSGNGLSAYQGTVNDLSAPLVKKAIDFRKKALDIAMEKGIESDVFYPMNLTAYRENPALPKVSQMLNYVHQEPFIFLDALRASKMDSRVLGWINDAVDKKNWLKISYLSQDQQVKNLLSPELIALTQALSYMVAGAQAEALELVKDIAPHLEGRTKILVLYALVHAYYGVRAVAQTQLYLDQLNAVLTPQDQNLWNVNQSMMLAEAGDWVKNSNQAQAAAQLASETKAQVVAPSPEPTATSEAVQAPSGAPSPQMSPSSSPSDAPLESLPTTSPSSSLTPVPAETPSPQPSPKPVPSGDDSGSEIIESSEGGG